MGPMLLCSTVSVTNAGALFWVVVVYSSVYGTKTKVPLLPSSKVPAAAAKERHASPPPPPSHDTNETNEHVVAEQQKWKVVAWRTRFKSTSLPLLLVVACHNN